VDVQGHARLSGTAAADQGGDPRKRNSEQKGEAMSWLRVGVMVAVAACSIVLLAVTHAPLWLGVISAVLVAFGGARFIGEGER